MDSTGSERWLSYAELAELRGISRKAAMRLTQRHRWRRQPGNDGLVRVLVPSEGERRQTPRHGPPPDPSAVAAFELALTTIREAHAAEVATLRERAQRAEEVAEALRLADEARKARGLLVRLRAAWRGE